MDWIWSNNLALAQHDCTHCHGVGSITGKRGRSVTCNCVFRSIFRACYEKFRYCSEKEKFMTRVSLEKTTGSRRRYSWGRKDEEYVADFCLLAKRYLSEEEHRIFRFHFLLGADWRLCCRRLKMDRGSFFHMVYRIQQCLGKVFRDLKPYGLYPLDEYFASTGRLAPEELRVPDAGKVVSIRRGMAPRPVAPPVRRAA